MQPSAVVPAPGVVGISAERLVIRHERGFRFRQVHQMVPDAPLAGQQVKVGAVEPHDKIGPTMVSCHHTEDPQAVDSQGIGHWPVVPQPVRHAGEGHNHFRRERVVEFCRGEVVQEPDFAHLRPGQRRAGIALRRLGPAVIGISRHLLQCAANLAPEVRSAFCDRLFPEDPQTADDLAIGYGIADAQLVLRIAEYSRLLRRKPVPHFVVNSSYSDRSLLCCSIVKGGLSSLTRFLQNFEGERDILGLQQAARRMTADAPPAPSCCSGSSPLPPNDEFSASPATGPSNPGASFLPEHTTAVSIFGRLLHHASVVVTSGDSHRMRQAPARGGITLKDK